MFITVTAHGMPDKTFREPGPIRVRASAIMAINPAGKDRTELEVANVGRIVVTESADIVAAMIAGPLSAAHARRAAAGHRDEIGA